MGVGGKSDAEEAFEGGLMFGLSMGYPMNLSVALGINVGVGGKCEVDDADQWATAASGVDGAAGGRSRTFHQVVYEAVVGMSRFSVCLLRGMVCVWLELFRFSLAGYNHCKY